MLAKETNLDKLDLTVETDGSLSPREAFEEASAILVNQYTALAGSTTVEAAPALGTEVADETSELNTSIEDLGLSARTANALINNEIRTVHDLVTLSEQDLRELKGFGSKALDEVKDKLAELSSKCTDTDIKDESSVANATNAVRFLKVLRPAW